MALRLAVQLLALGAHVAAPGTLQVNGRGMACAAWHGGAGPPPGMGTDCVQNHNVGSTGPLGAGNPWLGSLDAATGAPAPIPGVTEFFSNCLSIHGNFVPTAPGEGLGYARLNETSGPYAVAVVLPAGGQPGSVKKLTKVTDADWSPAWSVSDGAGGVVAWSYAEFHDTAVAGVTTRELLQVLDATDGSITATLGNVSASFPDGVIGPAPRMLNTRGGLVF